MGLLAVEHFGSFKAFTELVEELVDTTISWVNTTIVGTVVAGIAFVVNTLAVDIVVEAGTLVDKC